MRAILAGGGTGGHVIPALAIAQELQKLYGTEVLFIGTARGLENKLVRAAGFPLRLVEVGALNRVSLAIRLKTYFGLPMAIGAKLAAPNKKVVCFEGDGGLMCGILSEMEVGARYGLSMPISVSPAALDHLAPEHREVLLLRFIESMSYEQIARVVGCAVGTVRSRLHYAKKAMRDEIERMQHHERERTGKGATAL